MAASIEDQVVDYFQRLFSRLFGEPFSARLADQRLRRNAVLRQVDESADAASEALTRLFLNREIPADDVESLLQTIEAASDHLTADELTNSLVVPETIVEDLLDRALASDGRAVHDDSLYRVALHTVVQVLTLVGPVMAEWQKLSFSSTFELPRRIVNRLTQIGEQLDVLAGAGRSAADDRYELLYRDYLLQRFFRVDAGTVRMTTSLSVDVRELFVMPRLCERPPRETAAELGLAEDAALMSLEVARQLLTAPGESAQGTTEQDASEPVPVLDHVRSSGNVAIVGAPGAGKSTFLEWLQLRVASAEEELVMNGRQAIPLLLRVRQLDPLHLPEGGALVERALASRDQAALMPDGWIERQLRAGRVLLMLDGLDEVDPQLRDDRVIPWLAGLAARYPACRLLVSSRPVGYPPGTLAALGVAECDLLDFDPDQVREYVQHWCTAVRLSQNEPDQEARREGEAEGDRIVDGFKDHPYIVNLARNPLMLSAICLVNYFEGGELPRDRAVLYGLCVEGLVHNWDQRRGIRSEFGLEEKLRVCREVALAMQADDRAEYEEAQVRAIFRDVLGDAERADRLLEHVRYRTGLLLERRPGVFAFAHLTFQEYLAARAVHEGNRLGIDPPRLVREHADGRWKEVIALYCALAPAPAAREMLKLLVANDDSFALGDVLAEASLSAGPELRTDTALRHDVLTRIARAPVSRTSVRALDRFAKEDVEPVAWGALGECPLSHSQAFFWLLGQSGASPMHTTSAHMRVREMLMQKLLERWQSLSDASLSELVLITHRLCSAKGPLVTAWKPELYARPASPRLTIRMETRSDPTKMRTQAEIAFLALNGRVRSLSSAKTSKDKATELSDDLCRVLDVVLPPIFDVLATYDDDLPQAWPIASALPTVVDFRMRQPMPSHEATRREHRRAAAALAARLRQAADKAAQENPREDYTFFPEPRDRANEAALVLETWANMLGYLDGDWPREVQEETT
ncbi:MAG: NACHT domain-containing protein [Chloroflexota bacterium]